MYKERKVFFAGEAPLTNNSIQRQSVFNGMRSRIERECGKKTKDDSREKPIDAKSDVRVWRLL